MTRSSSNAGDVGCGSSSTACSTTPAGASSSSTTSWRTARTRPISTGSPSTSFPLNAYDHDQPPGYEAWWGLPALPKFNTDDPGRPRVPLGVGRSWIDFGIDGWRLDVANEIDDDDFWREFRRRVRAGNPEAYIVGEVWPECPALAPGRHVGRGDELPVHPRLHRLLHRRPRRPTSELDQTSFYAVDPARRRGRSARPRSSACWASTTRTSPPCMLNLLDSHDMRPVRHPRPGRPVGPPAGDALPDDLPRRPLDLLRRRDRPGRGGQTLGTQGFPWDHPEHWDTDTLAFHKRLIALRQSQSALQTGDYTHLFADPDVYAFARILERSTIITAANVAETPRQFDIPLSDLLAAQPPTAAILFATGGSPTSQRAALPPWS